MSTLRVESIRDWLRLRDIAPAYPEERRLRVERLARAAELRMRLGRDDSTKAAAIVGATALREAVTLLVHATSVAKTGREAEDVPSHWETLASKSGARFDSALVLATLRAASPTYVDDLSPEARARTRDALSAAAEWLRAGLDVRSETHLRGARMGQIAGAALLLLFLLYQLLASALKPTNIAYGKKVTASRIAAGGSGLVDGIKEGEIGVRTHPDARPWVMIDLGAEHRIDRVVVYNRGDRDLTVSLPYELEVSSDGNEFTALAQRSTWFGDGSLGARPWSIKTQVRARYVRLAAKGYVALSEVEVFGKP